MTVLTRDKELRYGRSSARGDFEGATSPSPRKRRRFHPAAWLLSAILITGLSFFFSGLQFVKGQLFASWTQQFDQFRWLIFVQGDQLQIDEVGSYLKQLDAVQNVTFISPEAAFQTIRKNALFVEDLKAMDPQLLPSSWEIQWRSGSWVDLENLRGTFREIEAFPGVLDVSYDVKQWKLIQETRKNWAQLKTFLSFGAMLALLAISVYVAWTFFFSPLQKIPAKSIFALLVFDLTMWGVGHLLVLKTLGSVPPVFLAFGLAIFPLHLLWVGRAEN